MKKAIFIVFGTLLATASLFVIGCNGNTEAAVAGAAPLSHDSQVKRGEYLVNIMGCNDCHSPKVMGPRGPEVDTGKALSGHPAQVAIGAIDTAALKSWVLFGPMTTVAAGPWGVSFSSNLTSSPTGIGEWTEERFFRAIREGKSKGLEGNRMLLPPMPWQNIATASDEDLKAVFAYLKSTKPVDNVVPQPIAPDQMVKMIR